MQISVTDPTSYFLVPQGIRTGGPECTHQLADAVVRRGYRSVLVPIRGFRGRTPDSQYDIFECELAERIPKGDGSVLVLGEVSPIESARELRQIPRERTWLWWLSVHNGPDPRNRYFVGVRSAALSSQGSMAVRATNFQQSTRVRSPSTECITQMRPVEASSRRHTHAPLRRIRRARAHEPLRLKP